MPEWTMADAIGSVGVAILLGAFGSNLLGKIQRTDTSYILANGIGAGLAAIAAWLIDYMPFVILEGIWCFVSISTLAAIHIRTQKL